MPRLVLYTVKDVRDHETSAPEKFSRSVRFELFWVNLTIVRPIVSIYFFFSQCIDLHVRILWNYHALSVPLAITETLILN